MRPLTTDFTNAILARNVRLAILADLLFPGASQYVWTGFGPLTANGNTYSGLGPLGTIGTVEERNDGTVTGLKLTLDGVPSALLAEALDTNYQGSQVNLYLACFDGSGNLLDSPYQFYGGTMDVMSVQDGTKTASITVSCENAMIETQRARTRRYTQFDQQIDYPSDTGFNFVASLQLMQIYWGNPNGPSANLPGNLAVTQNVT